MSPLLHRVRRGSSALAALVVVATLVGPAAEAGASKTASTTTTTLKGSSSECTTQQLSFSRPGAVSAQLGEEAFVITLTNVSAQRCQIHGYPTVRFYTSAGRLLTFGYAHTSIFFRRMSPRVVSLAPGAHGYFIVAKYRCDLGDRYVSSFFYLVAPYTSNTPSVEHVGGYRAGVMDYCKGPPRGLGHTLGISPIVASRSELFS